jgi:hypothetical protein
VVVRKHKRFVDSSGISVRQSKAFVVALGPIIAQRADAMFISRLFDRFFFERVHLFAVVASGFQVYTRQV